MSLTKDKITGGLLRLYEAKSDRLLASAENVQVHDLARISDGWETDVYSFAVEHVKSNERERQDLILRVYPGDDAPQESAHEFDVMKQLYEAGYPVPQVLLLEQDGALLGRPFVIMERIAGRSLGDISDESPVEKRLKLTTLMCRMFADLHALDWRPFAPDPSLYETREMSEILARQLSEWQGYAVAFQMSAFDPVFDWLKERLPSIRFGQPSVIHMDYHPYNILIGADGAAFVIDWTNAMVSDYRLDLAWTMLLMSTYGNPESGKFVLSEYEKAAGHSVEQIAYFEVIACVRRLFSILVSLGAGADKLGVRPGAEEMMKNVAHIENVYALLRQRTGIAIGKVEQLLSTLQ